MEEKLTVIVPTYNNAPWLPRCLDSILAQTYGNLEIIVVNDGSTDNTYELLCDLAKKADFKLSEDESGLTVRLFNYTENPTQATVKACGRIFRTNLDEVSRKFLGNDSVTVNLRGKEILTLHLQAYQ